MFVFIMAIAVGLASAGKSWHNSGHHQPHHPDFPTSNAIGGEPMPRLSRLDVVCSEDHMTVNMKFDRPFHGLVYSQANHHQQCVHVGPKAGLTDVTFNIRYDRCGTVEVHKGQFHENTVVIQYGADVLEAWDEAKRLRCEWLDSFEKQSSKPTVAIAELDIVELNFQGDDVDCWMEVQEGKGPWARQVGGLVPIGSPLTLVIAINDHSKEFDMRVKQCTAGDGTGHSVQLTDDDGCVVRSTLLTPFAKVRDFGGKASLIAYSHLHAFKFPDNLDVFVRCTVEVCRHGCPDACQGGGLLTNLHPSPRDPQHGLALLKQKKLAELANSQQQDIAVNHVGQHQSVKSFPPLSHGSYPQPGRERHKDVMITAAQKTIHHVFISNSSKDFNIHAQKTHILQQPESHQIFNAKEHQFPVAHHFQAPVSHGDVRHLFDQIKTHNNIQSIKSSKFDEQAVSSSKGETETHATVNHVHVGGYHHNSDQDVHWNSGLQKNSPNIKVPYFKPQDLQLKGPQPEPSAWTADEVKPLIKGVPFQQQNIVHSTNIYSAGELEEHVRTLHGVAPVPEPNAWTADEVTPFNKQKLFQPHAVVATYAKEEKPCCTDKIKAFHEKQEYRPPPTYFESTRAHIAPEPEPAPWTADNVKPLPYPPYPGLEQERLFEEPKPEPAAVWTLDDVKPLQEEEVFGHLKDLRHQSLNYKMKSHSHIPIEIPVYKESVPAYTVPTPITVPQPVYVPKYTTPSTYQNTSQMMMMNMMMMPTLLPYTYQTATWPQKHFARHLQKPGRHHYPYPIPQFTSRQQLMQSVVADRRSDDDESQLQYEVRPPVSGFVPPSLDEGIANDSVRPEPRKLKFDDDDTQEFDIGFRSVTSNNGMTGASTTGKEEIDSSTHQSKKRVRRSEPVFGVQHKFQAIALSDLAFDLNLTTDSTTLFRGRREEVVYGICMSHSSIGASVGFILLLTLCSLIASAVLYEHSLRLRSKTPHLSLLTRTFNGNLEPLYRIGMVRQN